MNSDNSMAVSVKRCTKKKKKKLKNKEKMKMCTLCDQNFLLFKSIKFVL